MADKLGGKNKQDKASRQEKDSFQMHAESKKLTRAGKILADRSPKQSDQTVRPDSPTEQSDQTVRPNRPIKQSDQTVLPNRPTKPSPEEKSCKNIVFLQQNFCSLIFAQW